MKAKIISLILLFIIISCNKIQEKKDDLIESSKNKAKSIAIKIWVKSLKNTFEFLTITEEFKVTDYYKYPAEFKVQNIEGKKLNFPGSFNTYFFKYKYSEREKILEFLLSQKTTHEELSDKSFFETNISENNYKLNFVEQNFPDNKKDILFFFEIKNIKNLNFYSCNRYPNQNLIAFDEENKIAYHLVDIYLD